MNTLDSAQSHWDDMTPEDDREPTLSEVQEALDALVEDSELLDQFITQERPSGHVTIIQLMHGRGLPWRDSTPRDDDLRDRYADALDSLMAEYRDWLAASGKLQTKADEVMRTAVAQAREDLAWAAEESRRDAA